MRTMMRICRKIEKENMNPVTYIVRSGSYVLDLLDVFRDCYEQDKMLYKAYAKKHPELDHDESVGEWTYSFTVGYVTVTGYLKDFNQNVYPEWSADRIYDPDDDMERRPRNQQ